MSTSFIDHATSYVNRAKKEAAKQAEEKAKKVQSAEELKKELQELQNLKRAIDDVVKADIEAMKKLDHNRGAQEKPAWGRKKHQMVQGCNEDNRRRT